MLREALGPDAYENTEVTYPDPNVSNLIKKFADVPSAPHVPLGTRSESWSFGLQSNISPLFEQDNNIPQPHHSDFEDFDGTNFSMLLPNDLFTSK